MLAKFIVSIFFKVPAAWNTPHLIATLVFLRVPPRVFSMWPMKDKHWMKKSQNMSDWLNKMVLARHFCRGG